MKFIITTYLFLLWSVHYGQVIGANNRILCAPKKSDCRFKDHKVKDVWPTTCDLEPGCNYLYPVLQENFDYNFNLPNIWSFRIDGGSDDGANASNNDWSTYVGDGYFDETQYPAPISNKNVILNNGILTLKLIPENITRGARDYVASSGAISTFTRFRTGIFEARIKVPTANIMWPAFWLFGKYGPYTEIDIFEFYDDNLSTTDVCQPYGLQKMSLHTGSIGNPYNKSCTRDDEYPLDVYAWHDYKLIWDEYSINIFVDGSFLARGFVTKYFRGNSLPVFPCLYGSSYNPIDALYNLDCEHLAIEPDNLLPTIPYIDFGPRPWWLNNSIPWPPLQPPQPYLANRVDESTYFPDKNSGMTLIISNVLNHNHKDMDLSSYTPSELDMKVDWVNIYQPFCCGVDKTVCSLYDLDSQTHNSDILTGRKLTIGNSSNTCLFNQNLPRGADWRDIPVILLATDEIAINGDAIFPGGTYAEMRITNCGISQRLSANEQNEINAYNTWKDSLINIGNEQTKQTMDSIIKNYVQQYKDSVLISYSVVNNDDLVITPNPVHDIFTINASELIVNKIKFITLVDANGKETEMIFSKKIDINNYEPGAYILKIVMIDKSIIYKKLIKS